MIHEDEPLIFSSSQTLSNDSVRPSLSLLIPPFPLSDDSDLSPIPAKNDTRTQSFSQTFNQAFNRSFNQSSQSPPPDNPFWLPNVKSEMSSTQPPSSIPLLEDEYGSAMMEQTQPLTQTVSAFLGSQSMNQSMNRSQLFHRSFGSSWDNIPVDRAPMDWSLATNTPDDSEPNSYYTSGYTSSATSPRSTSTTSLGVTPSHSASSASFSAYSPSSVNGGRKVNVGSHMRSLSPYDLSYTSIITQVRRRHGASCHLCKTTMPLEQLYVCAAKAKAGERKRRCRKKFCGSCLMRCHDLDMASLSETDRSRWICVSCSMLCQCAACQRRPNCEAMSQSIKQAMSHSSSLQALPIVSDRQPAQPVRATIARSNIDANPPFAFSAMDMFRVKQDPAQSTPIFQFPHAPHCARYKR